MEGRGALGDLGVRPFFKSGADSLGQISPRVIHLQITSGGDGDSVRKDNEVQATGVFGGGILDAGNATGIIGQPAQQLGRWHREH